MRGNLTRAFTPSPSHIHPSNSFHFLSLYTNTAEGGGPIGRRSRESDWGRDVFRSRRSAGQTQTATSSFYSSPALNKLNKEQVKLTKVNHRNTDCSQEVTQHTCGQHQEVDKNCFLYWIFNLLNVTISSIKGVIFSILLFSLFLFFSIFILLLVTAFSLHSHALVFCADLTSATSLSPDKVMV